MFSCFLWMLVVDSTFFFPVAMAALLREHGKDEQAELALRGELSVLNLTNCDIGDSGGHVVAAFLEHNKSTFQALLGVCSIGLHGIKILVEALKSNETLEMMYLVGNEVGDEGGDALIDALSFNVCITEVCHIGYVYNMDMQRREIVDYLTKTRNKCLIPAAVRRVSLFLIGIRCSSPGLGMGDLAILPSEIVKMITMEVWASRRDPKWIQALSDEEYAQRHEDFVDHWVRHNDY